MTTLFSATFSAIGVAAAQDLFEIVAPATSRVLIHQIEFGQYSDFGDAQDELLSILIMRGHTTGGSGGATVPAENLANFESWGRDPTATVKRNNTTVASAGSPETVYATAFNVRAGFLWPSAALSYLRQPITLEASERLVVRVTAPADSLTTNGTLVFEETGQLPA